MKEKNKKQQGNKIKKRVDFRNKNGITLIALVITIIVLLILAAVSIATLTGENGIISQTETAKSETDEGKMIEEIKLGYNAVKIGSNLENWNKDKEAVELEKELTNMNQIDEITAYKENLKDGKEVIIVEYVNKDKIYCIDDNSEIHECKVEYLLGDIQQETLESGEYAIVYNYYVLCNGNPNYASLTSTNKGEKLQKNMIWNVKTKDDQLLIYRIDQGTTKYLERAKQVTNGGYKLSLNDEEFYWNYEWNQENQYFKISTKVVSSNYVLRYYTSSAGWIVSNKQAGCSFFNIDKEISIID